MCVPKERGVYFRSDNSKAGQSRRRKAEGPAGVAWLPKTTMEERSCALCYAFLSAVAAFAAAVFLFYAKAITILPICNLFATLFIYYNIRALSAPNSDRGNPNGTFVAALSYAGG